MINYSEAQETCKKGLDWMFQTFGKVDVAAKVMEMYDQKLPRYLQQYTQPEKRYLEDLGSELDQYARRIRQNIYDSIRNHPRESLEGLTLKVTLFSSEEEKANFSQKVSDSIEELSYASKIAVAEAYRIWNVKSNIPIIGKIAKKKMQEYLGTTDFPSYRLVESKIEEIKNQAHEVQTYLGFSPARRLSQEEVQKKYQERMAFYGKFTDGRRLLAYDLDHGLETPKNNLENELEFNSRLVEEYSILGGEDNNRISFSKFRRRKIRERQLEAIRSPYNSWWEKLIGYIGYFFGFG